MAGLILFVAALGFLASLIIPKAPAADPTLAFNWNPFSETWKNLKFAKGNRTVFLSLLGISWFWFYGALFLSQFPNYSRAVLGGNEHVVTLLLALFSVGVAAGSLLCERLSGHKLEIGLVPFGSIGLSVFAVDLYFATPAGVTQSGLDAWQFLSQPGSWRIAVDLFLIGVFGGFYSVPLYALIQSRSEPRHRSRIIAANNILNALFMIAAACRRPIRFVMSHSIFNIPVLNFIFRSMKAIPIASAREAPEVLEQAFEEIAKALDDGQLVCIFPEGQLTRDGEIGVFRPGITRILERSPVPVIPMALSGLWRSIFSRNREKWRMAAMFPNIRLSVGKPVAAAFAAPDALHGVVRELLGVPEWDGALRN